MLKAGEVSQEKINAAKAKIASLSEEDLLDRKAVVDSLKNELLA